MQFNTKTLPFCLETKGLIENAPKWTEYHFRTSFFNQAFKELALMEKQKVKKY